MDAHLPLVSVIIPAFNCAPFAIKSVQEQDYPRREIIVVDDGSTDSTAAVLQSFGDTIRVLTRSNGGVGAARNSRLRQARGEYIAFLDRDDLWFPGKLTLQIRHLQAHPRVGLVFTNWVGWPESDDPRLPDRRPRADEPPSGAIDPEHSGRLYHRLLLGCGLLASTVLTQRSLIQEVGEFDETLRNGQDYDYWLRVARLTEIHKLAAVGTRPIIPKPRTTRTPWSPGRWLAGVRGALTGRPRIPSRSGTGWPMSASASRMSISGRGIRLSRGEVCFAGSGIGPCGHGSGHISSSALAPRLARWWNAR